MEMLKEIGYITGIELLELSSSLLIMWGVLQCRFKKSILHFMGALIFIIVMLTGVILSENLYNLSPICFLIELIVVLVCVKEKVPKKVMLYLAAYSGSYIISRLLQSVLSIVSNVNMHDFRQMFEMRMLVGALNIILVIIISVLISKYKKRKLTYLKEGSLRYYAVGIVGLLCCVVVLTFVGLDRGSSSNDIWDKVAVLSVSIVCVMFVVGSVGVVLIENSRNYYEEQSKLKENYLNMQQDHYNGIFENDHKIRRFRHDINAHISCMSMLSREEKYEELSSYIEEVSIEVEKLLIRKVSSGNDVIDALVNFMAANVENENIHIIFEGKFPKSLKVTAFDLCTIFSNAISNSVEECRGKEEEEKNIDISVRIYKDTLYIIIENPVKNPVNISILGNGTTKKDEKNHGYGISNIREAVEKYQGNIDFINTEGKFRVEILLPGVI